MTDAFYSDDVLIEAPRHVYRYLIADIRTNEIIAELPSNGCTYSFKLSEAGAFSATLSMNDEVLAQDPQTATIPGRNAIYVMRDDTVVWGGILWGRRYSVTERKLELDAETFESYLDRIFQASTKKWVNTEQLDIARWLLSSRQVQDSLMMDIGTTVSGRKRDRKMYKFEYKEIGEEMSQLAGLIDGFDYGVEVYHDRKTHEIRRKFQFYYPSRGRTPNKSSLVFEYPGSITSIDVDLDAQEGANIVFTLGSGTGAEMVVGSAVDSAQIAAGWPPLEISRSFTSVKDLATLNAHAKNVLVLKKTPIEIFNVNVRADVDPEIGTYTVGDWAKFEFDDPFIGEFSAWRRIVEISVSVSDKGVESISLTLDAGQEPREEEDDAAETEE